MFYLALMYHKLLCVVPTLTVTMKPISYCCAISFKLNVTSLNAIEDFVERNAESLKAEQS